MKGPHKSTRSNWFLVVARVELSFVAGNLCSFSFARLWQNHLSDGMCGISLIECFVDRSWSNWKSGHPSLWCHNIAESCSTRCAPIWGGILGLLGVVSRYRSVSESPIPCVTTIVGFRVVMM